MAKFELPDMPDMGAFTRMSMPNIQLPPDPLEGFYAETLYKRIVKQVQYAEENLKDGERLVAFYYPVAGERILIEDIGYHNTALIVIYGRDPQGLRCRALVHVAAFQMVMKVLPAGSPEPPRRIGFAGDVRPSGKQSEDESDEPSTDES